MPKEQRSHSSIHTQTPFPPSLCLPSYSSSHPSDHSPTPQVAESSSVKLISLPQPIPYSCWFRAYVWNSDSGKSLLNRAAAPSCTGCALHKDLWVEAQMQPMLSTSSPVPRPAAPQARGRHFVHAKRSISKAVSFLRLAQRCCT